MQESTGIMVCGHGSRDPHAVEEFSAIVETLRARLDGQPVAHGFLEFARPVIRTGLDTLREQGVRNVLAVPGMLFAAGHVKNDIPSVLNTYAASHDDMTIRLGRDLGVDTKLLRAAGDRILAACEAADQNGPVVGRHDTLLLVVGRGTSDPDANGNVAKVSRMLFEGLGFGWGETAYSGVTFPLVEPALRHAVQLGYRRIVVFPYFLFTGVLVRRIYAHTDAVAADCPDVSFVKAAYLNDHPLVQEAFVDRINEIVDGRGLMNCQLCKYREQVLGFEDEVGLQQESHHAHGRGCGDHVCAHDRRRSRYLRNGDGGSLAGGRLHPRSPALVPGICTAGSS